MLSLITQTHSSQQTLGLLTDLYQLTMAQGYWKSGTVDKTAVFHLYFRKAPFNSGFTLACGLEDALEYLKRLQFSQDDIEYLRELKGNDGSPLFENEFLNYLRNICFQCDVDAMPEGTVVFPHEPILRVKGPILQAQLAETALLNIINFQSLIATKAARICLAADGEPVIEFGLRRAQGIDGGLSATRAAYLGGCVGTSNVIAGKRYGIPVKGTHAHSWVMSFDNEREAFENYAKAMPNNCIFLVDTYDTLEGVRHAIEIGQWLRERGYNMAGIRLDSGDLAFLSIEARKLLDQAGFQNSFIVGSNDLDEHIISSLKQQNAMINVWGVGTKLVTAYDQPALGGVYKLSAIQKNDGSWQHKIKLSEQAAKTTTPGILQVRRFHAEGEFMGDAIYDVSRPTPELYTIVDPLDPLRRKHFMPNASFEDILVPVVRNGNVVYQYPSIHSIRDRVQCQLKQLHAGIKRFVNPHQYPVGLELGLHEYKVGLIMQARQQLL